MYVNSLSVKSFHLKAKFSCPVRAKFTGKKKIAMAIASTKSRRITPLQL